MPKSCELILGRLSSSHAPTLAHFTYPLPSFPHSLTYSRTTHFTSPNCCSECCCYGCHHRVVVFLIVFLVPVVVVVVCCCCLLLLFVVVVCCCSSCCFSHSFVFVCLFVCYFFIPLICRQHTSLCISIHSSEANTSM